MNLSNPHGFKATLNIFKQSPHSQPPWESWRSSKRNKPMLFALGSEFTALESWKYDRSKFVVKFAL